jgi:FAD binding domain
VIAAVRFARKHGLLTAVRGGGHSFPGYSVCDGGMVIDQSRMKGIRVDPAARTARAQAGVLLGELDREAQEFGLAVPTGIVTHTGLSGLTLGGGIAARAWPVLVLCGSRAARSRRQTSHESASPQPYGFPNTASLAFPRVTPTGATPRHSPGRGWYCARFAEKRQSYESGQGATRCVRWLAERASLSC